MMLKPRKPSESATEMTELVLPNDTNMLGNLMGGRLLHWMDIVAAITASRHCNRVCVTVGVDHVEFHAPIKEGSIVILQAKVTRAFNTSMEVKIRVFTEDFITAKRQLCNEAYYTFVAVDQLGRPIPVNPVEPETEEEKRDYEEALKRRELRLLLSGRLKPEKAKYFILKHKEDGAETAH